MIKKAFSFIQEMIFSTCHVPRTELRLERETQVMQGPPLHWWLPRLVRREEATKPIVLQVSAGLKTVWPTFIRMLGKQYE